MTRAHDSERQLVAMSWAQVIVAVVTLVLAMAGLMWAAGASLEHRFGKVELTRAETQLRLLHLENDVATNAAHLESFHHGF